MAIRLVLRVKIDDPATAKLRSFERVVDADFPTVPRVGEYVRLPGASFSQSLRTRKVVNVLYDLAGIVILEFDADGFAKNIDEQVEILTRADYEEKNAT